MKKRLSYLLLNCLLYFVSVGQDTTSQGIFHWEEDKNNQIKITDKITVEAHKINLSGNDSVVFLTKNYSADHYKINSDILFQRWCSFGNPAHNIYGFENYNFIISIITDKDQTIKKQLLNYINLIYATTSGVYEKTSFNNSVIYPIEISVLIDSADIINPVMKLTPLIDAFNNSVFDNCLCFYYSGSLIILRLDMGQNASIGQLLSFIDNFNPPNNNLRNVKSDWVVISHPEFLSYYKKYFLNK